jgi:hypothetical protein
MSHPAEVRKGEEAAEAGSGAGKSGTGRTLKVDWTVNIGEHVFALHVGRFSRNLRPSQVDVLVIGTRHGSRSLHRVFPAPLARCCFL